MTIGYRSIFGIATLAVWGLGIAAPAAMAEGMLSLKVENDMFASSDDGHYTNGVELNWTFAAQEGHWTHRVGDWMPDFLISSVDGVSYRLTHQIYTPDDIRRDTLATGDRPYAGVMLGGMSLHEERRLDGGRRLSDLNFDVGLVGPATGAEQLQRGMHRITDSRRPRGWDHQLDNEPIVNASYRRQWWSAHRVGSLELEQGPSVTGALGNLYTYAGVGYGMRLGKELERTFGTPAVSPSPGGRKYFTPSEAFGWYLFASLEGRYMARNLLLDGNTFEDSHSVDRREWVGDVLLGAALTWERWQLTYTNVWRSDEFSGQDGHDKFGSLTLGWHF